MHNVHSPEIRGEDCQNDWKGEATAKPESGRQDPSDPDSDKRILDDDSIGKSFEEEDESSFRSDDVSRSEVPSDDTFQTPSTSLQNLAICQQIQEGDIENDEIRSEIDNGNIGFQFDDEVQEAEETLKPNKGLSPPLFLIVDPESKVDSISLKSNGQTEGITGSPVGSTSSTSPCITKGFDLTQSTESNISRESHSSTSSGTNSSNNVRTKEPPIPILLQPGTYNSKPGRKKMWYHVFTPSYKTRSNDFRKYFKDLPPDERLIVDYSSALQKEILVQGRMYISQKFVSFYANIFGWQTSISIKFKDISTITKENTALVIPNAVQIVTPSEKYFFTSFVNRDSTFLMLFKLWQTALLDQNMPPKEIWKLVHACYGEVEIGSEEEEESTEDFLSLSSAGSLVKAPSVSTLHSVSDGDDTKSIGSARVCSAELNFPPRILVPTVHTTSGIADIVNTAGSLANGIVNVELIPTDLSDSSDSEEEPTADDISDAIPVCCSPHDDGKTVVDTIIPCDVNSLFTMLFTNSKFYLDFHTMRKTFDILQQEWQDKDGRTSRQVSFTVTLNQRMGPKHSQITETQILLPQSKPGYFYAVDIESSNAGIPYADAFYVTCHFCLSRLAQNPNQSRLIVVAQVRYRKSIWGLTKTFIEKNSWAGIDEFYSSLERSLKDECANMANIVSPPPSPRGKSQIRRRPLRKKGPAPGIPVGVAVSSDANANMPSAVPLSGDRMGLTAETLITSLDSSLILKVILSVLASLLVLNAFLYIKLTKLEESAASPIFFSPPPISFTKDVPQNHQEWLELLQKQEALHRFELQKWHDVLLSALKILKQAETDLESLKYQVDAYGHTRSYESVFVRSETPKAGGGGATTDDLSKYSTTQPPTASVT